MLELAREPVDCVVLDLEMPGTAGFEVQRRLQQRAIDTPVIVYTGTGSYDRHRHLLHAAVAAFTMPRLLAMGCGMDC